MAKKKDPYARLLAEVRRLKIAWTIRFGLLRAESLKVDKELCCPMAAPFRVGTHPADAVSNQDYVAFAQRYKLDRRQLRVVMRAADRPLSRLIVAREKEAAALRIELLKACGIGGMA